MNNLYINYVTYSYYDPTCYIEFSDNDNLKDDKDSSECEIHYWKISTPIDLIRALQYLIQDWSDIEQIKVQVQDFIKLLGDTYLGQTFFERTCQNLWWLFEKHIQLAHMITKEGNDLVICETDKNQDVLLPFYKEHKEFQKYILQYCLDHNLKFDNTWFNINQQDLQTWRHEHDVLKLKHALEVKQQQLKHAERYIQKLQSEIMDLQSTIQNLH